MPLVALLTVCALGLPGYAAMNMTASNGRLWTSMLVYFCTTYCWDCYAGALAVALPSALLGAALFIGFWFSATTRVVFIDATRIDAGVSSTTRFLLTRRGFVSTQGFLFGGFLIPVDDIHWPLKLFHWMFPLGFALRSITHEDFVDASWDACDKYVRPRGSSTDGSRRRRGRDVDIPWRRVRGDVSRRRRGRDVDIPSRPARVSGTTRRRTATAKTTPRTAVPEGKFSEACRLSTR